MSKSPFKTPKIKTPKAPKILGVSFSANRALGITQAKTKIAKATGIPLTKQGRQRKMERMLSKATGCRTPFVILLTLLTTTLIFLVKAVFAFCK